MKNKYVKKGLMLLQIKEKQMYKKVLGKGKKMTKIYVDILEKSW